MSFSVVVVALGMVVVSTIIFKKAIASNRNSPAAQLSGVGFSVEPDGPQVSTPRGLPGKPMRPRPSTT